MTWAGCYVFDLRCDSRSMHPYGNKTAEYTAETGREAKAAARRDGWFFAEDGSGHCLCPQCAALTYPEKKRRKKKEPTKMFGWNETIQKLYSNESQKGDDHDRND